MRKQTCLIAAGVMPNILKKGLELSFSILKTVHHVTIAKLIVFNDRLMRIP